MTPLRVLVVEDSEDDALLLVREMRQGGFDVTYARVETAEDMKAALESGAWDVVISDYSMPRFSAPAALELLKTTGLDLPFIIVSGKVGEEVAVETMRAGAQDFFLKGSLARLVPAIERELEQAAQRREKRKAEEANSQLAAIVESSSDAIIGRNFDGTVTAWNAGAERLYGYSAEEVLGRTMSLHVPADRAGEIRSYVDRIRRGEIVDNFETVRIRKDGTRIDVSLTVSPIRSRSGEVIGASTIARDITLQKRIEESLRQSERRFSLAFRASPVPIIIRDIETDRYVDLNEQFVHVLGYPRAEVIGRTPSEVGLFVNSEDFKRVAEGSLAGEQELEIQLYGRSGEIHDVVGSVARIEVGGAPCVLSIFFDVTKRKLAEKEMRKSEERFRRLFDSNTIGITVADLSGQILESNDAYLTMVGYTRKELLAGVVRWDNMTPAEYRESDRLAVEQLKRTGVAQPYEKELIRKDGTRVPLLIGIATLEASEGGIIAYSVDLTARRLLEEQFRQAQKMEAVGQLAGGVAHDFNNLLTAILGYAQLAAARLKQEDPMRIELSEIEKAGQRAADLTRQLLAFSRKQVLQPRVINLNEVVSDTDKMLRRLIGENIELATSLKEPLGSVRADQGQISQVLLNLSVNSRDAMPKGGKLTIETSEVDLDESYSAFHFDIQPGPYVLLAVSDTGTGMDAKTLSHVFEPFFTTKTIGRGTGLGLSTVYGIVKQSGGYVTVYSEPGVGTTVKIYLPRVKGLPDRASGSFKRRRQAGGNETVLVVEDEEAVRRLVCRSLEAQGYKIVPAASASEALLACEKHTGEIQLMLTDVVMPHLSGRELAQRIATLRPRMKVLFMSGYTDNAIVHHGELDAGTPFLQKPFTPHTLAAKVREVLDAPEKKPAV